MIKVDIPAKVDESTEEADKFYESVGMVDYRDNPEETLEAIDDQLKKFGLEVRVFNSDDDNYVFDIVKLDGV